MRGRSVPAWIASVILLAACAALVPGCETGAQTGGLAGAGIGALAGQAIGGNTTATLIGAGAGVGAGVGYVVGNESDKKKARQRSQQTQARNYDHDQTAPLSGTSWTVVSVEPDPRAPGAHTTVDFGRNSHVVTITVRPDGSERTMVERYRVVDDMLIVNQDDAVVNYRYTIRGDRMTLSCDRFSAILRRR